MVTAAATTTTTKTHVAILPSPGLGHVTPLLELAKQLVTHHDCRVSFLVVTTNVPSASLDQLLDPTALPPYIDLVPLPLVDVSKLTSSDTILARLNAMVDESFKSLKSVLTDLSTKPKALVIDIFCTGAFDVCREMSIPVYSFFTASTALFTFSLYLPTLDRDVEGEFVDLPEPIQIPGCDPVRPDDLLDQVKNRKIEEYRVFLHHVSRMPLSAGIFLNSWMDLEPKSIKAISENPFYKQIRTPPVHPIGPLIKHDEPLSSSDFQCLEWLDQQPPESVLFVSLGSGGTLTAEQLTEMAWGLEMSEQRFIFVTRIPSNTSASASFFTVGSDPTDPKAYLPEGFLDRTKERGLVVPSWAPQVAVLKHRSTGGFLSHCGWNSTLEGVSAGVPMIAWPLYAEQRMNATMLEEQIGIAIKPVAEEGGGVVARGEIERVVRVVMEGDGGKAMRKKVKELKESAGRVLGPGGPSFNGLAGVVKEWKSGPNQEK